MTIDRAGVPFIVGALLPAVAFAALQRPYFAVASAALAVFVTFFFRDPSRDVPPDSSLVLAPADGRIMHAGDADERVAPSGDMAWTQISIFLSPMDVHVNRTPVSGRVTDVAYRPGRFLAAYKAEAATENERSEVWIDHAGQTVVCRQVVGFLARRVVCRLAPGMDVRQGERLGIMKFGSRMDVFLPKALNLQLEVRIGQTVTGGETVLTRFLTPGSPPARVMEDNQL